MAVAPDVTREIVKAELLQVRHLARSYGWDIREKLEDLVFTVNLKSSVDKEEYLMEFQCDNYKEWPPFIEFIDIQTGERGIKKAYPKNGNGFFHTHPCICAEFNRKAYKQHGGGPHAEWDVGNWMRARPQINTLGDIIILIQRLLNNNNFYKGRMG